MKKLLMILLCLPFVFATCKKSDKSGNNNCNIKTLTDIDGNVYNVVSIGNQCWTKENLNVSKFANGEQIPQITSNSQWATTTKPAWCYYGNSSGNGVIYGKLYNAYALNDLRGIAPKGWPVPTPKDWEVLFAFLGGNEIAGKHMKVSGNGKFGTNNSGTNSSGFSALPGGHRVGYTGASNQGNFAVGNQWAIFAATKGGSFYITYFRDKVYFGNWLGNSWNNGISVRFVKE